MTFRLTPRSLHWMTLNCWGYISVHTGPYQAPRLKASHTDSCVCCVFQCVIHPCMWSTPRTLVIRCRSWQRWPQSNYIDDHSWWELPHSDLIDRVPNSPWKFISRELTTLIIQLYAEQYGCYTMSKSGEKIVGRTEEAFLTRFKSDRTQYRTEIT